LDRDSIARELDEIAQFIGRDSKFYAAAFVREARGAARSLKRFAERGRVVPEVADPEIRELFVSSYRLVYKNRWAKQGSCPAANPGSPFDYADRRPVSIETSALAPARQDVIELILSEIVVPHKSGSSLHLSNHMGRIIPPKDPRR